MNDLTEEQQLESLRQFWTEWGGRILAVLALVAAGFGGFNVWQANQRSAALSASDLYVSAVEAADEADITLLQQRFARLSSEHPDSPYVLQAGMRVAALHMQRGESEEAAAVLSELLADAPDAVEAPLLALRLARVELYLERPDAALATLEPHRDSYLGAAISEVRGDALLARGETDAAREAYQFALDEGAAARLVDAEMLRIKRNALGPAPVADETS